MKFGVLINVLYWFRALGSTVVTSFTTAIIKKRPLVVVTREASFAFSVVTIYKIDAVVPVGLSFFSQNDLNDFRYFVTCPRWGTLPLCTYSPVEGKRKKYRKQNSVCQITAETRSELRP